jgi:hypothetical protein
MIGPAFIEEKKPCLRNYIPKGIGRKKPKKKNTKR